MPNQEFQRDGFLVKRGFFSQPELDNIKPILEAFHGEWKIKNAEFYGKQAINSAYITHLESLMPKQRQALFKFIAAKKLVDLSNEILTEKSAFLGTQLFFDPVNKDQKNYWHRDPQYHLSVEEQQQALKGHEVIHIRVPLVDEPGLGLIPGTHKRWDTEDELDVRLENNGKKNSASLSTGIEVPLNAGDVLVFSANMIHRGLYGNNRFAFDILFCDSVSEFGEFIVKECLPTQEEFDQFEDPSVFYNAWQLKSQ